MRHVQGFSEVGARGDGVLIHVLLWNELEEVSKWLFYDAFPHLFCMHYISSQVISLLSLPHIVKAF